MEIKLTEEEINEVEDRVARLYSQKKEQQYIDPKDESVSHIMGQADIIIKKYPSLTYKDIFLTIEEGECLECYLKYYITEDDMKSILEKYLKQALDVKKSNYGWYLKLKNKFEDVSNV